MFELCLIATLLLREPAYRRRIGRIRRWKRQQRLAALVAGTHCVTVTGKIRRKVLKPYREQQLPVTARREMARRRRAYVGWWKWQLYNRYDAVSPIGSRKLAQAVRRRLKSAIGRKVLTSTVALIGCSVGEFRRHLESSFSATMTWDNYGVKWEIDHIVPLSKFDLSKEFQVRMACHYSNMRPLMRWANGRKSDRIILVARQSQLPLPIQR